MLPLNLPARFWRPLVGRPVRRRDLNAVDTSLGERNVGARAAAVAG